MRLDRTATLALARGVQSVGVVTPTPGIPILMYHSVSDRVDDGVPAYFRLATSANRFRAHMRWLKDKGYAVITLADAANRLAMRNLATERCAVVTFDDGLREVLDIVWPILQAFSF